ncbi:hypothetical protein RQP46_011090 [Phenoliferia psychrophenolica]
MMEIERQLPKASNRGALPRLRPTPYPNRIVRLVLPAPERTITIPQLPLEIIRQIITEYARTLNPLDERRTALALTEIGRTSKTFLHLSREALYYQLSIKTSHHSHSPITKFITFQHLAAYVHRLRIDVERPADANCVLAAFSACRQVSDLRLKVFGNNRNLSSFLRSISLATTSLRKLYVRRDVPWQESTNTDEDLDNAWWSLLHAQTNLEHLVITDFPLPSRPSPHPSPTAPLKHLTLNGDSIEPVVFSRLAQSSESSLRRLVISVYNMTMNKAHFDLSPFTNLVKLTLKGMPPVADALARQIRQLSLTNLKVTTTDEEESSEDGSPLVPTNWLEHLPPTLRIACLPLHPTSDVIAFLESGDCPHLEHLCIPTLCVEYGKYGDWSPWIEVAVATACARRGLRFIQRDPHDPQEPLEPVVASAARGWENDWNTEVGEPGQMTLDQMWARGR